VVALINAGGPTVGSWLADEYGAGSQVLNNNVYGNPTGIRASGPDSGDAILVQGNRVHNNTGTGVSAGSRVELVDSDIYGQAGNNETGIYVSGGVWVSGNRVYLNYRGITSLGSTLESNRVFANQREGIYADSESLVQGNKIYSNAIGIDTSEGFRGRIDSNILYSNTDAGLRLNPDASDPVVVRNNTIIQSVGDGLRITALPETLELHNNILWVGAGYGLDLTVSGTDGLNSDYNLFYRKADPNAHFAGLNQANFDSLASWQAQSGLNAHSLVGDPVFVDPDGADNVLGYQAANNGVDGGRLGRGQGELRHNQRRPGLRFRDGFRFPDPQPDAADGACSDSA
jgi:Right handed beta helix region